MNTKQDNPNKKEILVIKHKCYNCGMKPFWNGKQMPLVLGRVDDKSDDENQIWRLICANCDSQLNPENYESDYEDSEYEYDEETT
jgi:hypothetical protein